jgi:sec-independent protein translocase protein TatA
MGILSPMHLALVMVIALLVFGPKKLPEIGKELGKAIREFKKASRDVMESFHEALEDRPHPVSSYDPAAVSTYYPSEETFQRAAEASSLGETPAGETPAIQASTPIGTVERPLHSTQGPATEVNGSPPDRAVEAAGRETGRTVWSEDQGNTPRPSGEPSERPAGEPAVAPVQVSQPAADTVHRTERVA